jgi:serine beta-lactamase-like protein LACTB, mitochondrial
MLTLSLSVNARLLRRPWFLTMPYDRKRNVPTSGKGRMLGVAQAFEKAPRRGLAATVALYLALGTLSVVAGAPTVAQEQAQEKGLGAEKRGRIGKTIEDFRAARSVPGISASVVMNGELVWAEGFGVADLENYIAATPSTLYRLGSISKPITAVAVMQQWEQGKLDLDAPVQKYCPAFPEKDKPITTREVLGHLGGIRHYKQDENPNDPEVGNTKHFDDPIADGLKFFANDPLLDSPGTKFHYTTHGYTLAGCVLEGASHEKYVNYVREHVFVPADMYDTQSDNRYSVVQHRTQFYSKNKSGAVINADFLDSSYKIPGGGLISSADDMARFAIAVLGGKLLKGSAREAMWTVQHTSDGEATGYALGWGVDDKLGVRRISHGGGQQGTSTFLALVPERRVAVVVLANMDSVDVGELADQVVKIVLDMKEKPE